MPEYSENQVVEPKFGFDASVSDEAMRLYCPEYFDEEKPDYEWDEEDNLVAYVQFDSFSEEVFRRFIEVKKLEIKKRRYYNPGNGDTLYPIGDDIVIKEGNDEPGWEESRRILWAEGVLFERVEWDDESKENKTAFAEVLKSQDTCRIWLRVRGNNEKLKKRLMTDLLYWFEQNALSYAPTSYFVCSCSKCRSKKFREAYAIQYKYILNFYENFIPKIQCYGSGEPNRIDSFSNLTQPKLHALILHHDEDEAYLKSFRHHFPKKRWDFEVIVWDRTQILPGGEKDKDLEEEIEKADVIVALVSPDFINDEGIVKKHLRQIISRSKNRMGLFVPLEIRSCVWQYLLRDSGEDVPNQVLLSRPNQDDKPTDKSWEDASSKIHSTIEKWLKNRSKPDYYL